MFSQVCVCSTFGGGVPHPRSGWGGVYPIPGLDGKEGTPSQVWMVGGYPSQIWMVGGTPARSGWWGIPHSMSGWWGIPHPRSGWWGGVPGIPLWPGLDGGGVPWVTPLARSGWWGGTPVTPLARSGWWGYPRYPHHDWMGYPPP